MLVPASTIRISRPCSPSVRAGTSGGRAERRTSTDFVPHLSVHGAGRGAAGDHAQIGSTSCRRRPVGFASPAAVAWRASGARQVRHTRGVWRTSTLSFVSAARDLLACRAGSRRAPRRAAERSDANGARVWHWASCAGRPEAGMVFMKLCPRRVPRRWADAGLREIALGVLSDADRSAADFGGSASRAGSRRARVPSARGGAGYEAWTLIAFGPLGPGSES